MIRPDSGFALVYNRSFEVKKNPQKKSFLTIFFSRKIVVVADNVVGSETVQFDLYDDTTLVQSLGTAQLSADFPFGYSASLTVNRVEQQWPIGAVRVLASIPSINTFNVQDERTVLIDCEPCFNPGSAVNGFDCAPACNDPNGCELIGNARPCAG